MPSPYQCPQSGDTLAPLPSPWARQRELEDLLRSSSAPLLLSRHSYYVAVVTALQPRLPPPSRLRYKVTQVELFALLCRLADELLFRQISWIKKLPFFCELSIEDYTCLLSSTWQELILLSCFTIYSAQIFGELADVTAKYAPSDDELQR